MSWERYHNKRKRRYKENKREKGDSVHLHMMGESRQKKKWGNSLPRVQKRERESERER